MPRSSFDRRNLSGHPVAWGLTIVAVAAFACLPAIAPAQGKSKKGSADHEKKTGKVAEVEKKGKTATIKVEESDGETFDVPVTTRTKFIVNGKGDAGFFKHPRAFVSSKSVFTANNQFFGKNFTIHIGNPPNAQFEPEPDNPEVYHIAGAIVDCDETSFTINADGSTYKVNFEQGGDLTVAIESTEPEHAVKGSDVAVEGSTRNGKFIATSVVVTLDKPLVADEVFADKKTGKTKSAAASKTSKKPAKTDKGDKGDKEESADKGDDTPAGEPFKPGNNDPFDVRKKDSKKKAPAKPKVKKPVNPDADADN
jgi:hypothetical protein